MKLDLKKMASVINGKKSDPPTKEQLAAFQAKLSEKGLGYDPVRMKVYQLAKSKNEGVIKSTKPGIQVITEKDVEKVVELPGLQKMKKGAQLSDEELMKKGFRRDPKTGDIFPIK